MSAASVAAKAKYRALDFGITRVALEERDGNCYVRVDQALEPFAHRLTDRLVHWAATAPDRSFIARRSLNADGTRGDWQRVTYAGALDAARSIGQALLDLKASVERQSRSSRKIALSMRWLRSVRSTLASRIARCRPPIRWSAKTLTSCGMSLICSHRAWCTRAT